MIKSTFKIYCGIILVLFIVAGCNTPGSLKSKQKIEVTVIRFDKELFNLDVYSSRDSIKNFAGKYPDFIPLFSNKIIEIGDTSDPWFCDALLTFVTDQAVYNIYKNVLAVFPDFKEQQNELNDGFSRFKLIFPEKEIPTIYTYVSGFNQSVVTADSLLGISLEKYLGTNNPFYNEVYPPVPKYQRYRMNPYNIAPDAIKAWISAELEYSPLQNNLLSQMLYEGSIMYILKQIFPDGADTLLWNFTIDQMNFCLNNEKQMWTYLIEQKLLFSTDRFRINQFIEDAPFTKDFSTDSPGKAAVWIGYRIVENYVKKNNISIEKLSKENDYQFVLNESRYSP